MQQDDGEDEAASGGDCDDDPPESGDGPGETGCARGDVADGARGGQDETVDNCDERELRLQWDEHVRACRRLERDPAMPASIVSKARALRDEAERRWRAARTPHPLSKRTRWAGADLRAAEEREAAQRKELQLHLDEAARRTRELEARVQVAADRTARKRAALQELLAEGVPAGVPEQDKWPMALAATAVTGIAQSIAPPLAAAIERLSSPLEGDAAEGVRQELQLAAASLGNLEQLLRGRLLPTAPLGAAAPHYDISGGDVDGDAGEAGEDARDGGDNKRRAVPARGTGAASASTTPATRWTKAAGSAPWTRTDSSAMAVEEARRLLGPGSCGAAAATIGVAQQRGQASAAASDPSGGGSADASAAAAAATMDRSAYTNDLAIAEQRAREASEAQMRQALHHQQLQQTMEQQQLEEQQRLQRQQRQQEEQRRHQLAMEQAAATRAAEEARQREEAFARMSPEERERAMALHAQHQAVGAQAFGTQAASQLAELVHRSHVQSVARGAADGDAEENVAYLMSLSPEEFAEYENQQMGGGGMP